MKRALYIISIFSLAMLSFIPAVSAQTVDTGFTRSEGGGDAPIIKAKWEMNNNMPIESISQTRPLDDDLQTSGAQFDPPGVWGATKDFYVCAIATDPDGVADINAVYADIYYPEDVLLGPGHEDRGCGEQHGLEIKLTELPKQTGYDLFCSNVRNNHSALPVFGDGYDYDEICAQDGELMKETAKVYCKYSSLKWEDPAGEYKVVVHAADNAGIDSVPMVNYFEYLPLTSFEIDFQNVNYGNVKLNTHKIINGDLTWDPSTSDKPTVRNTGNTRLNMTVMQDDMGLGKTVNGDEWWNVSWDARLGSDASFTVYEPYKVATLESTLELSQTEEMDFSILVTKFPLDTGVNGIYSGTMTLGAVTEVPLACFD